MRPRFSFDRFGNSRPTQASFAGETMQRVTFLIPLAQVNHHLVSQLGGGIKTAVMDGGRRETSFLDRIGNILFASAWEQMARVDTQSVITTVATIKSRWDGAIDQLVGYPMRWLSSKLSIAILSTLTRPVPALVGGECVKPKVTLKWVYHVLHSAVSLAHQRYYYSICGAPNTPVATGG